MGEAFAPVPLACVKAVGMKMDRLNVNGGAMALGHPLGGTGAKLLTTLVHEMERSNTQYGMLAICEGGGTANALIIENVAGPKSSFEEFCAHEPCMPKERACLDDLISIDSLSF